MPAIMGSRDDKGETGVILQSLGYICETSKNSLTFIAAALGRQSELDDIDDPMTFTSAFEQITVQQLFDFSDDTWTKLMERIGMRS